VVVVDLFKLFAERFCCGQQTSVSLIGTKYTYKK
jgi:hypothetical protein